MRRLLQQGSQEMTVAWTRGSSGGRKKCVDLENVLRIESAEPAGGLDVGGEEKRKTKADSYDFGLSNRVGGGAIS